MHHGPVAAKVERGGSEASAGRDWWIGLDGWVLQDGNYTDFVTGERRQFALEFGYRRDRRLRIVGSPTAAICRHSGRSSVFEITGQLLRSSAEPHGDGFVLDFGLLAYSNWIVLDDLQPPDAGAWLTGEVHLGVDPFFYMDELAQLPGMPALIYTWTIVEIQLNTTPLMPVEHGHPLYGGPDEGPHYVGNPDQESWRTVDRTRAWDDDGSYRLRCRLHNVEPTSSMRATGDRSPHGPLVPES
jgi:hypothetical protein